MKQYLVSFFLLCLSISTFAQSDKQEWKDLERWGKDGSRRYAQGDEIKMMIQEAQRRDASPYQRRRQEPVISNVDILRMKAAGLSDEVILHTISTRQCLFDRSPDMLIEMRRLGLSDAVLKAILSYGPEALIPVDKNGLPTELGIYAVKGNDFVEIDAEPISWQAGGEQKRFWTNFAAGAGSAALNVALPGLGLVVYPFAQYYGTTKGHVNAKVMGQRSRYAIERQNELIFRTPEGVAPSEYLLVQLYEKDNRREFRILTGGFIHPSSGVERTAQGFTYNKLAPRVYSVVLPNLASGEYGFLPTFQVNPTNAAFVGKLYAFSI